jgi:hypothetical protein
MPKKKTSETPEQQSERFKAAVREAIDAGELSPTDAERGVEMVVDHNAALLEERRKRS